ncbi:MAG: DoxX family protein [Acidobacteria bacterium]|nr:DoxX family protein [Acidobacteriota bacterium]
MFRKLIATAPTWFTLPVRLALGAIFFAHGAQKVFGWWGGRGFSASVSGTPPFGFMRPAWFWMGAAVFSEFLGSLLVFFGLLTRVGAFFIMCVVLTAMFGVHWAGGFFMSSQPIPGIEYTLALLGMSLALVIAGGGQASIDMGLMKARRR